MATNARPASGSPRGVIDPRSHAGRRRLLEPHRRLRRSELSGAELVHPLPQLSRSSPRLRGPSSTAPPPRDIWPSGPAGWPAPPAWMRADDRKDDDEDETQSHGERVSVLIFRLGDGMAGLPHPDRRRGHDAPARAPGSPPLQPDLRRTGEPARSGSALRLAPRLAGRGGIVRQPARLVVLRDRDRAETWAFAADEVLGVRQRAAQPVARAFPRRWSIRPSGSARRSCRGTDGASACSTNSGSSRRCGVWEP